MAIKPPLSLLSPEARTLALALSRTRPKWYDDAAFWSLARNVRKAYVWEASVEEAAGALVRGSRARRKAFCEAAGMIAPTTRRRTDSRIARNVRRPDKLPGQPVCRATEKLVKRAYALYAPGRRSEEQAPREISRPERAAPNPSSIERYLELAARAEAEGDVRRARAYWLNAVRVEQATRAGR